MKTIGRCVYCGDEIYDFQAIVNVGRKKVHTGCLHILADENPCDRKENI